MQLKSAKFLVALAGGLFFAPLAPVSAQSQSPEQKTEQQPSAEDKAREAQMKEAQERAMRELEEASKLPKGAGQPECLWLGRLGLPRRPREIHLPLSRPHGPHRSKSAAEIGGAGSHVLGASGLEAVTVFGNRFPRNKNAQGASFS
jgi:hypothetical protein